MAEHAKLSASSAHRWLKCTKSVKLEENYKEVTSVYAKEGTFAHELAELLLSYEFEKVDKITYEKQLKKLIKNKYYNKALHDYVDKYVGTVLENVNDLKSKDKIVCFEEKLKFDNWVKDGFGTGDVVVIAGSTAKIIDLKFGQGVKVYAQNNPQLRLYALGVYQEFGYLYDIEEIEMIILQPRLDHYSSEKIKLQELLDWGEEVKKIASLAYKGEGKYKAGEHCKFCKAKYACRERAKNNLELSIRYKFKDKDKLEDIEISNILGFSKVIQDWLKDIEQYALQESLEGKCYKGYKLVEGRKIRKFRDETKVIDILKQNDFSELEIYKEPEVKSITNLEKIIGKKRFNVLLGDIVEITEGKPTLVSISDKRPAINSISSAKADFEDIKM